MERQQHASTPELPLALRRLDAAPLLLSSAIIVRPLVRRVLVVLLLRLLLVAVQIRLRRHVHFVAALLLLLVLVLVLVWMAVLLRGHILFVAMLLLRGNERSGISVLRIAVLWLVRRRRLSGARTARIDRRPPGAPRSVGSDSIGPASSSVVLCASAPLGDDIVRLGVSGGTAKARRNVVRRSSNARHRRHLMFLHDRDGPLDLDSVCAGHVWQGVGAGFEVCVLRLVVERRRRAVDDRSVVRRRRKDVGRRVLGFVAAAAAPAAAAAAAGVAAHHAADQTQQRRKNDEADDHAQDDEGVPAGVSGAVAGGHGRRNQLADTLFHAWGTSVSRAHVYTTIRAGKEGLTSVVGRERRAEIPDLVSNIALLQHDTHRRL